MPPWAQFVVGLAALAAAVTYIYSKVIRPGAKLISTMDKLLPIAVELTEQFHEAPEAFATLRQIAAQFHADSGTSLRDVINRLETAANDNRTAVAVLQSNLEAARILAGQDRTQLAEQTAKLNRANAGISTAATKAAGVADDLEEAHIRAEEHEADSVPGQASDSAMRRPPPELEQ